MPPWTCCGWAAVCGYWGGGVLRGNQSLLWGPELRAQASTPLFSGSPLVPPCLPHLSLTGPWLSPVCSDHHDL